MFNYSQFFNNLNCFSKAWGNLPEKNKIKFISLSTRPMNRILDHRSLLVSGKHESWHFFGAPLGSALFDMVYFALAFAFVVVSHWLQ